MVPLVSSWCTGPLEIAHLPRMWMEDLLTATGRMPEAFAGGRPLFDEMLCEIIGLDRAAFRAFVTSRKPDYLGAEHWVAANAQNLERGHIITVGTTIFRIMDGDMPAFQRDDLRAWKALHAYVLASRGRSVEPIVPTLSSRTSGPLGADHLPRLWMKNLVKTIGALPWNYRAGPVRIVPSGMSFVRQDSMATRTKNLGIDMYAAAAFVDATQPDYRRLRRVREHATKIDAESIARQNAMPCFTRPAKAVAEKAAVGWLEETNWGYLIDDLLDWRLQYEVLTRQPVISTWSGPPPDGSRFIR